MKNVKLLRKYLVEIVRTEKNAPAKENRTVYCQEKFYSYGGACVTLCLLSNVAVFWRCVLPVLFYLWQTAAEEKVFLIIIWHKMKNS